jgi:polysaccharide export outer membrane protein/exopolysaccharide production protein ExoF
MCASALVAMAIAAPLSASERYRLGPQDQVRLKVYEWRASLDTIFEWTAMNDDFTVGANGSLSIPFVGSIQAEGLSPELLASVIAERLVSAMGLGRTPDVAVEVIKFRPFYVVGHVDGPGEYTYRPGLTVLQALSIAGGLRTREEDMARVEREVIAGQGEIGVLSLTHLSLLARRARLQAELAGADDVEAPQALTDGGPEEITGVMMEQERDLFAARRDGLETQLRAMTELRQFLQRETESLGKQLGFLDQEIESLDEELLTVMSLVERGLAPAPRQQALERSLLQVRGDRLAAETALLRARQESSRTDISILQLKSARASEVAGELREVELQLNEIERRTDTALNLLHESETLGPRLLALRWEAEQAEPTYTIVRPTESGSVEIEATEATLVQPGDTVKIEIPPASPLGLQGAASGRRDLGPGAESSASVNGAALLLEATNTE